jgi:diguanylate cyclase (GGDEF)-like protein
MVKPMATPVSTHPNSSPNTTVTNASQSKSTISHELNASAQFKLTSLLQTTIELEPLFELFFGQLQHLLKLGGCQFQNQNRNILLKLGTVNTHKCDYSLNIQQQYLGNISFSRKQRFSTDELAQIEALLGTLVYPLRNALNYRDALNQALSDPLTGLGNRGALENAFEYQWQMAQRYEQDLGLLMIDIDFFKKINDTHGHDIGDYVIKKVAESINATTRQTDLTFRYGGEEFLVLLNKTTPIGSTIIAERIRENVASLQLKNHNGEAIQVTVSVGGSHLRAGVDKHHFLKEADQALYRAKEAGRNRVEFFQDEVESHHSGHLSV